MLVALPRNLAKLSQACSTESARYGATTGIRVKATSDGLYRLEVTNGRILAVVQGPLEPEPLAVNGFALEPGEVMVPKETWDKAFKVKPPRNCRPIFALPHLGSDGKAVEILACDTTLKAEAVEGRFPDVDNVLPGVPPVARFCVDPWLFIDLLKVAADVMTNDESKRVEVLFWGFDKPVGVCARNSEGQTFDGLIVPLVVREDAA
jgi:hypothetical protein